MGRFQRTEAAGLIAFLACAVCGMIVMSLYMSAMPAIWQISQRLFLTASGIVALCSVGAFVIGYLRTNKKFTGSYLIRLAKHTFEITALSTMYGATMFLMSFALLSIINGIIGRSAMNSYLPVLCSALSGIVGYATLIQAELLEAKTVASLLPLFVISGAATAGLTSDDPYWYNNNFSQLGDRTTFAASMFNATLVLAGLCIIITSYFAISEFIATQHEILTRNSQEKTKHFKVRITIMAALLILGGIAFIGIGTFRYTPHPILHDLCARGVTGLICTMLVCLPWLAPRLSRTFYIASDLAVALTSWAGNQWLHGHNTLTNVEALSCLLFLGWIIVFSRQVAAMQSDRLQLKINQMIIANKESQTGKSHVVYQRSQ
ncbi:ABC transporter permease [Gardnerella sp. Marseille-Q2328]|uniref:ABC transporter permease n=1 Tax=Gardnerella sp. Marseille-Q2328 TaxID=2759694 RepID=UPI0020258C8A|nr:ABC transporter permease [Gardnerella sp. Marseille-Q2328]